jgi:hypothetical protein
MYEGSAETAGPASVRIVGVLGADGAVIRPRVTIHLDDVLTAAEARELAALLFAQADEIDRLASE